jgi:hypothetical protein
VKVFSTGRAPQIGAKHIRGFVNKHEKHVKVLLSEVLRSDLESVNCGRATARKRCARQG